MPNFLVEFAEPSILPRIHFSAEERVKGAVDFLNTTFFSEIFTNENTTAGTSAAAPTKLSEQVAAQAGQIIQDLAPKAVNLGSLFSGGSGENHNSSTPPPIRPASPSQVKEIFL
jgi:hypothetical protein